jgi:N-acetylglucosamine-6-phosphate deacetylase
MSYFDLQVNGCFGVDFNADQLDPHAVNEACQNLRSDGVGHILAAVITNDIEKMKVRLANIVTARTSNPLVAEIIHGIHIEGPFISAVNGFVGAHPAHHVLPACVETMQTLLEAADGLVKMVTLAPENDSQQNVTRFLTSQNITVSAGHTDASLDQLKAAVDAGLSSFTHLGNGCPLTLHRHDNIIQRVLSISAQLSIGLIADGVHIPYHVLKNFLAVAGIDRSFIVTDAISAAGKGSGTFRLAGQKVFVDENLATWSADRENLVGSAMTMPKAVSNLQSKLGLSEQEIIQLTSINPRELIGFASPGADQ